MKKIYQSKTIILNAITAVIIITANVLDEKLIANPKFVLIAGMVVSFGNIILRTFTSKPIDNGTGESGPNQNISLK